jgi:predicted DNA-binding transcriptional regulator AlpA
VNDDTRTVLEVLGDGGTTEMATRVLAWLSGGNRGLGVAPGNIVDRAEIATMTGLSRAKLAKVVKNGGAFPAPFRTLECGEELYDREQVERWIAGNPDLVGGA